MKNMSLANLKAKEGKGKKKVLPKLKTILANPNKTRCPVLDEQELLNLKVLLQTAIQKSKLEPRCFATQKGICIGLESSLRKINNQTSSCVFISLSIKPNHVINLIARNAENKDRRQPVYAQPKLENYIEEIFGVQALCMVFPKDLLAIDNKLYEWVEQRKKPLQIEKVPDKTKTVKKIKITEPKMEKMDVKKEKIAPKVDNSNVTKAWSGDFISFGNDNNRMCNSKLDGEDAVKALSEVIDKIPSSSKIMPIISKKIEHMEVDSDNDHKIDGNNSNTMDDVCTDSDDFLEGYKNLIVHKIKGNPNKNPKKKRRKNKKKNPSK